MPLVVVREPAIELAENGDCVGARVASNLVALEHLDERLGHSVGLRAADGREARRQSKSQGEIDRFGRGVAAPVVREVLDSKRCAVPTEPLFDGSQHHVANDFAADAGGCSAPGNGFAIASVECE